MKVISQTHKYSKPTKPEIAPSLRGDKYIIIGCGGTGAIVAEALLKLCESMTLPLDEMSIHLVEIDRPQQRLQMLPVNERPACEQMIDHIRHLPGAALIRVVGGTGKTHMAYRYASFGPTPLFYYEGHRGRTRECGINWPPDRCGACADLLTSNVSGWRTMSDGDHRCYAYRSWLNREYPHTDNALRRLLTISWLADLAALRLGESRSDYFLPPALWPASLKQVTGKDFEWIDEPWKGTKRRIKIISCQSLPPRGEDDKGRMRMPANNRFDPLPLGSDGRARVRSYLDHLAHRRSTYRGVPDQLRVRVDGEERLRFDPRGKTGKPFRVSADSMFIEVCGDDGYGDLLFAAFLVPPSDALDGSSCEELVSVESGYKISCGISPIRSKSGKAHSHRVRITWEDRAASIVSSAFTNSAATDDRKWIERRE